MLNNLYWLQSLSTPETKAIISWLEANGVTPDTFLSFMEEMTYGINLQSMSVQDIATLINRFKERGFKKIPEENQYHITIAFGRMMKWAFENDIQSQTIDLLKIKKELSENLTPLGINSHYFFSYVLNIKDKAVEDTIYHHKNRWPFDPHKLDHLYIMLVKFQFIKESGHFKDMFFIDIPSPENRILWLKNRTDLIYLGYGLYNKIYKEKYVEVINMIFRVKNRNGQMSTLPQLKRSYRNVRCFFDPPDLKENWKTIDSLIRQISLD